MHQGSTDEVSTAALDVHCTFPGTEYGYLWRFYSYFGLDGVGRLSGSCATVTLSCVAFLSLSPCLQVLRTVPKAVKAGARSMADTDAENAGPTSAAAASPAEASAGSRSSSSDLDSIFARLEEQEKKAGKAGALFDSTRVFRCQASLTGVPVFVTKRVRFFLLPTVVSKQHKACLLPFGTVALYAKGYQVRVLVRGRCLCP